MACGVTLKRSLELDSLLSPESSLKRRRTSLTTGHCAPFRPVFSNSQPHQQQQQQQQQPQPQQQQPQQQQHQQQPGFDPQQSSNNTGASGNPSAFVRTANDPKISPEELEMYLMSAINSRRRDRLSPQNRQSFPDGSDSESEQHMDSSASAGVPTQSMLFRGHALSSEASSSAQQERPLFTFKQVRMICERLLKEQEIRLREEYDQVLNARLAEQYDTFVRFTYDQIHRRIDDSPMTYLS